MPIYNALLILCWLVFLGYWFISAFSAKRTAAYGWQWIVTRVGLLVILLWVLYSRNFQDIQQTPSSLVTTPLLSMLGVIVAVVGIGFAIWARKHLGRNWGMPMTIKAEPELVTSGPYQYVRHPIYTGVILAILGSALVVGLPWLVMGVIATSYFMYSATQEEKVMLRKFPQQYPKYKRRTKMIIPFIW